MTMNKISKLLATTVVMLASSATMVAQDKIVHPDISYAGTPRELVLGGMNVSGIDGYEDYMLTGISGLQVGQKVSLPGCREEILASRTILVRADFCRLYCRQ